MSDKKEIRKELAKKISDKVDELNSVESIEQLVNDNKIEFEINKVTYRIRKSNYKETELVRRERNKKKTELLENPKYRLREELITIYKKHGKDIKEMERVINSFPSKFKPIQIRLAQATTPKDIALFKAELKKLEESQFELIIEKNECLDGCIENAITEYANLYMVYLV